MLRLMLSIRTRDACHNKKASNHVMHDMSAMLPLQR